MLFFIFLIVVAYDNNPPPWTTTISTVKVWSKFEISLEKSTNQPILMANFFLLGLEIEINRNCRTPIVKVIWF
jgi:hypothetical protein